METWIKTVEVLPDWTGAWKIVAHWNSGHSAIVHRTRYKRTAYTWARGFCTAAGSRPTKYGKIELLVKNKKGVIRVKDTIGEVWHV